MASNEHSALDNTQLHVPKDFSSASANTVLTKNGSNALTWADDNLRRILGTRLLLILLTMHKMLLHKHNYIVLEVVM